MVSSFTAAKEYIIQQLVDIYIQLEGLQLSHIGRPIFENDASGGVRIGPAFFDYDTNASSIPQGPFSTSFEWYKACIEHRQSLIQRGEVATSAPKDAALACNYLLDCVHSGLVHGDYNSGPFYLKHVDTRDVNYLIDDNYTIMGIIDWELAFAAPKESAFQSPVFMFNIGHVYQGNRLSPDEELFAEQFVKVGCKDLAQFVREGWNSFVFEMCAAADPYDRAQFERLLCTLWGSMNDKSEKELSWEEWKSMVQRDHTDESPVAE